MSFKKDSKNINENNENIQNSSLDDIIKCNWICNWFNSQKFINVKLNFLGN